MARPSSVKKQPPTAAPRFVAFLRGINVGGRVVKMADLKNAFANLGYGDIKTIGASGNVLFSAADANESTIAKQAESVLQKAFGAPICVQIRPLDHLRELVASDPFRAVKVSPNTRLYVSFLGAVTKPRSGLRLPYDVPGKSMSILSVSRTEIYSYLNLSDDVGTLDLMEFIESEFGKNLTTRNWNTVCKVAA